MRHSKLMLALAALASVASVASFSSVAAAQPYAPGYHHGGYSPRQQHIAANALRQIDRINHDLRRGLISPAKARALKAHYRAIAYQAGAYRGPVDRHDQHVLTQRMNAHAHRAPY